MTALLSERQGREARPKSRRSVACFGQCFIRIYTKQWVARLGRSSREPVAFAMNGMVPTVLATDVILVPISLCVP